jgi:hypothetical protein
VGGGAADHVRVEPGGVWGERHIRRTKGALVLEPAQAAGRVRLGIEAVT